MRWIISCHRLSGNHEAGLSWTAAAVLSPAGSGSPGNRAWPCTSAACPQHNVTLGSVLGLVGLIGRAVGNPYLRWIGVICYRLFFRIVCRVMHSDNDPVDAVVVARVQQRCRQ